MRFTLAMLVGKLVGLLGKVTSRATNLPGELALKICPDLFRHFQFDGKVLAVTGSNGKTSTSNMVAFILRENGKSVAHNAKGSNLLGGVATTLLTHSNFGGRVPHDFVVLEVDERYSRLIFRDFSPDYMLVTNLFRDQLTRNGNVDVIIEKLQEAIKPSVKLILNANDPISANLSPENERVYYGVDRTSHSTGESLNITHDAKVCPKCYHKMQYSFFHYNHIGAYTCSGCGYTNPKTAYQITDVDLDQGDMLFNGSRVHTEYRSVFNIFNMAGALSACCELGIKAVDACTALSRFRLMKERYDEMMVGSRRAVMILSKNQNPVSFDQSISHVLDLKGDKTVVVYVGNINHTNNRDTTWLYDISFERLQKEVSSVVCTGPRAYDLAVRLSLGGFTPEQIQVERDLGKLRPVMEQTTGTICILTELYDAKAVLEVITK